MTPPQSGTLAFPKTFRVISEALEEQLPELWRTCYPRRYNEIGGSQYDSPKAVARAMMDAFLGYAALGPYMTDPHAGQTEKIEALWASMMVRYNVPVYYLSRDIGEALTKTTPTETLDCMNIKLPFDAAAFMLPLDVFSHAEYGPISFVAYTRNFRDTELNCPHPSGPQSKYTLHNMTDTFTVFLRTLNGKTLHWTYDNSIRLIDLKNQEELEELQRNYSHTSRRGSEAQDFTPTDIVAMNGAIKIIFNIILLLTHKPEMIEPARLLKRVTKGPGRPIEYWSPHIIGRTYKLRYEHSADGGTHASPRGHWVSGFWREQPHGPQRSLRKTLWIEPFWRGGEIS